MTFLEDEDSRELRQSLRRFLSGRSSSAAVRALTESETGSDPEVWKQLTGQLGLAGLAVPEDLGGAGYRPRELSVVLEELGASLFSGPFFSTVALAAQALVASGDDAAQERWLPQIATGDRTATLAVGEAGTSWATARIGTHAVPAAGGTGWSLTGTKTSVVDGASAGLLLVVAATDDGPGLFGLERTAAGVSTVALSPLDQTRRLATVELAGARAERIGAARTGAGAIEMLDRIRDLALVGLAAEQLGGAQRCLTMAVDYAKLRDAFGRKIGSFEAIKHKCANNLVRVETGRSALIHAANSVDAGGTELSIAAAVAASACSEAFTTAARDNIQIHGGIGFTWEHDAHLYFKRAVADNLLLGTPAMHRTRLAALIGVPVAVG
jgi:alkylation response protein AidB-like acyl-CoA dehydrogenase